MWIADSHADKIYAYDLKTRAQASGKDFATLKGAGNIQPTSIWSDGKTMWVGGLTGPEDLRLRYDDKGAGPSKGLRDTQGRREHFAVRIWSNGATMLVSDHTDDKIYAYNMPSAPGVSIQPPKPVVETPAFDRMPRWTSQGWLPPRNNYPLGIWTDWATIWVADPEDDKIYAYDSRPRRGPPTTTSIHSSPPATIPRSASGPTV